MTRIGIASIDRRHLVPFLMAAVVLVLAVDMFTNTTGPVHDANAYVDIAENGLLGNENLVAPFAYRPALPLIVSALSKISSLPVMDSFRIVNRVCAVLVLFMTFVLADAISSRLHHVAIVGVVVALSFHNVKFPLFFYTLVDVGAFWVLLLAFWMLLQRWFGLCLLTCCVGVWFKEFLIVPAVLLMVALAREYRSGRSLYAGALIALGSVMMVASVVLPRVLLSTKASYQFFDPVGDPRGFSMLWSVPLNLKRDINLVLSWLSYWMPSLLLVTVARGRAVWERLEGWRLYLVMYVVLNVALAKLFRRRGLSETGRIP